MTGKKTIYWVGVTILIVIIGMFLQKRVGHKGCISEFKRKAKAVTQVFNQNIRTIVSKANIYDEEGKLTLHRELYVSFNPYKVKFIREDVNEDSTYIYVKNGDKEWRSGERMIAWEYVFMYLLHASEQLSRNLVLLEEESTMGEIDGNKCYEVNFLYRDRWKIKAYYEMSTLKLLKNEVFLKRNEQWNKLFESLTTNFVKVEGIWFEQETIVRSYTGNEFDLKRYVIEANVVFEGDVFAIPET